MKKTLIIILALITVFAFCGTASASGNIDGREFNWDGTYINNSVYDKSRTEITVDMTGPYGALYGNASKAVALVDPSLYCTVDRVRIKPRYSSDLRIDPNYTSNWVGPGKANLDKQVEAVQTILWAMGYYPPDLIDGEWGTYTDNAIKAFQANRNLTADGIVGPNTWRALCSAKYFTYGSSIWGSTN